MLSAMASFSGAAALKVTLGLEETDKEDVTEEEEKKCRLCWGDEGDGSLVQPCACRGSAKWIHKACLEEWRRTSPKQDAAYRCGQCKDEYRDALSLELLRARLQAERTNGQSTACTLDTLAWELQSQGKHDEAEPLYREALEVIRAELGDRHLQTLTIISNLGVLLRVKGDHQWRAQAAQRLADHAAAEPLLREALEVRRETLGSRHQSTLDSIGSLGSLFYSKGDLLAAESLYREALEGERETLGNRHSSTLNSIHNFGMLQQAKGDLAAAEPLYREALEGQRETLGNRHPHTITSIRNLGVLLRDKGDLTAAEPLLREALKVLQETLGSRHPRTRNLVVALEVLEVTLLIHPLLQVDLAAGAPPP